MHDKLNRNVLLKKYLILFAVVFSVLIFNSCGKDKPPDPRANDYVYVCSSNSAKTYHTFRDCPSLKNCSKDILEVTRRKAQENERIICSNCSKREAEKENKSDSVKN
jgi:hypothetical protein